MATAAAIAVELDAVSIEFGRESESAVRAIDKVTLALPEGSITGILGANGSGKTTLLKLIGGLVQPTHGRVWRAGGDEEHAEDSAARSFTLVRPELFVADPSQTVRHMLEDVADTSGHAVGTIWDYLEPYASMDQFRSQRERPVGELSSGQRSMLAIVLALLRNPTLLLLDEPTQALDLLATDLLSADVRRFAHIRGTTTVVASTEPHIIQKLCDHVAIIHCGQVIVAQPIHTLLAAYQHTHYQIRFHGQLAARWQVWFDGLKIGWEADTTTLSGILPDQAALHGVLMRVRDLNLPLVSVNRVPPDLQAVYVQVLRAHEFG